MNDELPRVIGARFGGGVGWRYGVSRRDLPLDLAQKRLQVVLIGPRPGNFPRSFRGVSGREGRAPYQQKDRKEAA
jgi:hypothetical protein